MTLSAFSVCSPRVVDEAPGLESPGGLATDIARSRSEKSTFEFSH